MTKPTCKHCKIERFDTHPDEHKELCCDCFDLSWFYDEPGCLDRINEDREARGRSLVPPWPEE